jgi:hypothetical protein
VTSQQVDDITSIEDKKGPGRNVKKIPFPKRVGIVFVENFEKPKVADIYEKLPTIFKVKDNEKKNTIKLEFDQVAFAHLLLQLNRNQNLFDFQIIPSNLPTIFEIPERRQKNRGKVISDWFIKAVDPNCRQESSVNDINVKDISHCFSKGVKNFKQSEYEKNMK